MAIPKYSGFARPILEVLLNHPDGLTRGEIYSGVADHVGLDEEDRSQLNESGQPTFKNRIGWAQSYLKHAGFVDNPRRGHWVITQEGKDRVENDPDPISQEELKELGRRFSDRSNEPPSQIEELEQEGTPEENIEVAVREIRNAVRDEVLEYLVGGTPEFFERTVLNVLEGMGYTGITGRSEHRGQVGDGGIDGIIYMDRLGLERVFVQAKRWQDTVGRDRVQAFAGAMDGERASKGVIFTTARFSSGASHFAEQSSMIIRLVDGPELASLMVEFGIGVSRNRTIVLPEIDKDFFDEE